MQGEEPNLEPAQAPEMARIQRDLLCAFCGYNLRTLGLRAVCPECGEPVWASVYRLRRTHMSLGSIAACVGYLTPLAAALLMCLGVAQIGPCGNEMGAAVFLVTLAVTPLSFIVGTVASWNRGTKGALAANVIGLGICAGLLLVAVLH
ncbi:MAG TPA: hypothetical protein VGM03_17105 [Phycisphaerae bacterium]|jgi:hypothetical protein